MATNITKEQLEKLLKQYERAYIEDTLAGDNFKVGKDKEGKKETEEPKERRLVFDPNSITNKPKIAGENSQTNGDERNIPAKLPDKNKPVFYEQINENPSYGKDRINVANDVDSGSKITDENFKPNNVGQEIDNNPKEPLVEMTSLKPSGEEKKIVQHNNNEENFDRNANDLANGKIINKITNEPLLPNTYNDQKEGVNQGNEKINEQGEIARLDRLIKKNKKDGEVDTPTVENGIQNEAKEAEPIKQNISNNLYNKKPIADETKKPGFWARLFGRGGGGKENVIKDAQQRANDAGSMSRLENSFWPSDEREQ